MAIAQQPSRRLVRPVGTDALLGAAGFVASLIIVVVGNYNVSKDENGGTGPAFFSAIICLVVAAALFGYVVPRASNIDRTTLILGAVAFVSLVVFWLGVAPILGAAAWAVGRRASTPTRMVRAGQILGAIGGLVALVGTIVGQAV